MSKKPAPQPTEPDQKDQSPFDRFKAALAQVVKVPKASLDTHKKSRKKSA